MDAARNFQEAVKRAGALCDATDYAGALAITPPWQEIEPLFEDWGKFDVPTRESLASQVCLRAYLDGTQFVPSTGIDLRDLDRAMGNLYKVRELMSHAIAAVDLALNAGWQGILTANIALLRRLRGEKVEPEYRLAYAKGAASKNDYLRVALHLLMLAQQDPRENNASIIAELSHLYRFVALNQDRFGRAILLFADALLVRHMRYSLMDCVQVTRRSLDPGFLQPGIPGPLEWQNSTTDPRTFMRQPVDLTPYQFALYRPL